MMKKLLLLFLFFVGCLVYSNPQDNPFLESEKNPEMSITTDKINSTKETNTGPGDPTNDPDDPPAPIDDYLPLLLITAIGIIVYNARRNKKSLS